MKIFLILWCISIIAITFPTAANPLIAPQAVISEFTFDSNGRWIMEIGFIYNTVYHPGDFDSICISSTAGYSRIRLGNIADGDTIFVIASDSLVKQLTIDPHGDCIKLYSYGSHFSPDIAMVDSITFGNVEDAMFDILQSGYSISRSPGIPVFVKDRTPSIGVVNDTSGTLGTLHGRIFDSQNRQVYSGNLWIDTPILFGTDGSYSTRIYSRKYTLNDVSKKLSRGGYTFLPAQPFSIYLEPDSTMEHDIHLLVEYTDRIRENIAPEEENISLISYPNPFNAETNFSLVVPPSLKYRKGNIAIYNVTGQKIRDIAISGNSAARWDGTNSRGETQSTGIYYYRLVLDNRFVKEGSMILLK